MCDIRLPPRSSREPRSSGLLRSVFLATSYQRFGTTYRSHPQGSRIQKEITTTGCVMTVRTYQAAGCRKPEDHTLL